MLGPALKASVGFVTSNEEGEPKVTVAGTTECAKLGVDDATQVGETLRVVDGIVDGLADGSVLRENDGQLERVTVGAMECTMVGVDDTMTVGAVLGCVQKTIIGWTEGIMLGSKEGAELRVNDDLSVGDVSLGVIDRLFKGAKMVSKQARQKKLCSALPKLRHLE